MASNKEGKPFRFQAAWCADDVYPTLVKNAWKKNLGNVSIALSNVRQDSLVFNKETFGNIFHKKKEYEARLQGIQRSLEHVDYASITILRRDILHKYEKVLYQEKLFGLKNLKKSGLA